MFWRVGLISAPLHEPFHCKSDNGLAFCCQIICACNLGLQVANGVKDKFFFKFMTFGNLLV